MRCASRLARPLAQRAANGSPATTRLASRSWRTRIQSADANPRRPGLRSISTPFVARSAARRTPTLSEWSAVRRRRSRSAMNALSSAPRSSLRNAANRLELRSRACVEPATWLASVRRPQRKVDRTATRPARLRVDLSEHVRQQLADGRWRAELANRYPLQRSAGFRRRIFRARCPLQRAVVRA
jgi:hypothetical protein